MGGDQDKDGKAGEVRYWLWQACITLLAGFITSQNLRHGTLAVKPTGEDIGYALIAFVIIFAAVISFTRLVARFNDRTELENQRSSDDS